MLTCDKCERPLSSRYYLHIFHENGREERIYQGVEPDHPDGKIFVYVDANCEESKKVKNPIVIDRDRRYTLSDLEISRKGRRFLLVLPRI